MKKVLLLSGLCALTACTPPSREQILSIYHNRCMDYGYQPGTKEFADCMKEQEARHDTLEIENRKVRALEDKNSILRTQLYEQQRENRAVKEDKKTKSY